MQRLLDTRHHASITISGQELFFSKMKGTFDAMVRKAQSDQLSSIHNMLTSTDMVLRPELEQQKSVIEKRIAPFKRMSTTLGTRKQQDNFVRMMETELMATVKAQDCESGIKLLTETLKKQHVNNFAMQQQLMTAMNKKTEIENWKQSLEKTARKSQSQLVEQNMSNIGDMKQLQILVSEFTANYG